MKSSTLLVIPLVLLLSGCEWFGPKKIEIVYVSKPVMYVPPPPKLPQVELQVDKLKTTDRNDPGLVGQAYKHDTAYLRSYKKTCDATLAVYEQSSGNFDSVNKMIDEMIQKNTAVVPATPATSTTP